MCSFRKVDERHVFAEVTLMEWSPTMDLVALATIQGDVLLHRLSWQKVWTLSSPGGKDKEVKVRVIVWRPDGKVLAIGYDTGTVILCDVEKAAILYTIDNPAPVTSMVWVPKSNLPTAEGCHFYSDMSAHFLPKLPSLSKSYSSAKQAEENVEDTKKLKGQTQLNILIIGTSEGQLRLHCFGVFPAGCVTVDVPNRQQPESLKIVSMALSTDLSLLNVIVESSDEDRIQYDLLSFAIPLLKCKFQEMQVVAQKYGEIMSLLGYLTATIKAISEAWEDILLEIDSKLMSYAETKFKTSSGTVSDDFLELLMFGTPTENLENFLLKELTEKGLKKLGHSIELSYSNIQKLVLKHLQCVSQAIYYHLVDLRGMAKWEERFSEVCLSSDSVSSAITATNSFLLKAIEIQQVIDISMKNFKAFFRWLYAVIMRLSDEPIPPEITKVTQQDLNFVATFLKENFATEWNQDKKSTFSLERVGQYLKMENLSFPAINVQNPWTTFLNDNPQLKESGLVFPYFPEKSLVKQHVELRESIEKAFDGPSSVLGVSLELCRHLVLHKTDQILDNPIKASHFSTNLWMFSAVMLDPTPCSILYLFRQSLQAPADIQVVSVNFGIIEQSESGCSKHLILDAQFYSQDVISLLLIEDWESEQNVKAAPVLIQFPLKSVFTNTIENMCRGSELDKIVNLTGGKLVDKMIMRRLENMSAKCIAVSGSRKVACVLFASGRRVRLFEMDVEEEEEEDTDPESSIIKDDLLNDSNVSNTVEVDNSTKENSF